ncbi:MAG: glycosyl hydrolase, partial [Prevotella sp.]|nr:glycosyl hydrolase [Prevotella sp.]
FYNHVEKCWWMLYTQRRVEEQTADVSYCYGNRIGIAQSDDNGASWYYRGTLDLEFERGHNTFWAPEVIYHRGIYHLFVAYIKGVRTNWGGEKTLIHYTSKNLWDWKYRGRLEVGSHSVIDITVFRKPDGSWRAWYKDEPIN